MTENLCEGKRNAYMDFLKGIAIIAVVAGHSLSDIRSMDILFNVIYSFHMPLLFFVSAYIEEQYRTKYRGTESRMLIKRMRGLLLPYLSWIIISAAVSEGASWYHAAVVQHEFGEVWKAVQALLLELFGYGKNGLWFFPVLFGLKIIHALYWAIRTKTGGEGIVADFLILGGLEIVTALLAFFTRQPYLINMLSYAIPYFLAILIVRHEALQRMLNSEWLTAGAIFAYALAFPFFSFYDTGWMTQALRIGLSLCVIAVCCRLNDSRFLPEGSRIYKAVCVCGENSLAIYVLHGFLMDYKQYFYSIDSVFIVGVLAVVLACVVAAVCIAAAKVIGISSWWRSVLFGR